MTPQDYIADKSVAIPEAGCWIWMGAVTPAGYGFANPPGRKKQNELAHRASYRIFVGEIPQGMIVAHSCDNPYCVNPSHLWLATHKQNSQDMVKKRRQASGEKSGKSKLTAEQVKFIRESDLSNRKLGEMLGVSHANIGYIKRGATWIRG
jgi:hypothetical protein